MGAECKYELSQAAYMKLVLHSLKYCCSTVNGVLAGHLVEGSSPSPATVEISDAVPLSHAGISLVPSLELSLNLVEKHFGAEGLSIVGYYHANERYGDSELGSAAKRIRDHIFRYFPRTAVLLLDVEKTEELPKRKGRDLVVQLYSRDSSKNWHQSGSDGTNQLNLKEPLANEVLLDCIASEK